MFVTLGVMSRSGDFAGLELNLVECVMRVGVTMGVFSTSSGSCDSGSGSKLLRAKMSTPLLFLAAPEIPLFLGDDDRGGGIESLLVDFREDGAWLGERPVSAVPSIQCSY